MDPTSRTHDAPMEVRGVAVETRPDGTRTTLTLLPTEGAEFPERAVRRDLTAVVRRGAPGLGARILVLRGLGTPQSAEAAAPRFKHPADAAELVALCRRLEEIPRPVIGVADGRVSGLHLDLLLACDLSIASSRATFAFGEILSGEVSPLLVTRAIGLLGRRVAGYLAATGGELDAATALALGLLNEVVPRDQLDARVDALVEKLNRRPPRGLAVTKRMVAKSANADYVTAEEIGRALAYRAEAKR
ncbi:MAG: enoyl-CoA hydratase/isomerase family protein [Chloroflexota bacterium]|nr:MAG: enoyl-CoA hydratase/isomerase family protein [Chloroflexota bacterium]